MHSIASSSCLGQGSMAPACSMQTRAPLPSALVFGSARSFTNKVKQHCRTGVDRRGSCKVRAASQDEEELPPWARGERARKLASLSTDLPFGVYLLGSAIVAIAATGSWFELSNKNPIFGVLGPDNPLYNVILGFFGVSGYPTAGFFFYKAIKSANSASEQADKADGY